MRAAVVVSLIGLAVVALPFFAAAMDGHDVPDPSLTPGLIASADLAEVCAADGKPGSAYNRVHRATTENDRKADFARYGIAWSDHHNYRDDHLLPLCLGGADAPKNRWPQPGWGIWSYHVKDRLEAYTCQMVCAGRINLRAAQQWFLAPADWRDAYRRIFGDPR
jgi:hypothetical protein